MSEPNREQWEDQERWKAELEWQEEQRIMTKPIVERLRHEMTPDGESTALWAMRQAGFMGSPKQLACCARCGEPLPPGYDKARRLRNMFKSSMHFLCDPCWKALP